MVATQIFPRGRCCAVLSQYVGALTLSLETLAMVVNLHAHRYAFVSMCTRSKNSEILDLYCAMYDDTAEAATATK